MRTRGTLVLLIAALAPLAALAADPPAQPPPMGVWTGKGQVGFMASQGNSVAKSANAALDMAYLTGPWKHALHFDLLYASSAGITSAERWNALWQSNYNLSTTLYAFGALQYHHDLFDGFQYQASGTAGIGYKVFDTKTIHLSVQAGAGYQSERPQALIIVGGVVTSRQNLRRRGYAIGTAGLDYSQQLTSSTTLSDTFSIQAGSANSIIVNTLALAVKMSKKLALSLGYNIQDNTHPPATVKSLDTVETVNLVYAF